MEPERTEDPLSTLVAEEATRADGRYLIYYRWPGTPDATSAPSDQQADPDAGPDV